MESLDLEAYLERPTCPSCAKARVRPVDIHGNSLTFECPEPSCSWRGFATLPEIKKKTVYLDTSIVSHMARALARGEESGPWIELREALREATAAEVICCPGSSIVEDESGLSRDGREIAQLSRQLGDPGLRHHAAVQDAQLTRALRRYLLGEQPDTETRPPAEDAFYDHPHQWTGMFHISVSPRILPAEKVVERRGVKATVHEHVERAYRQYERDGIEYDQIRTQEAEGLGRGLLNAGRRALSYRLGTGAPTEADAINMFVPTTLDVLVFHIRNLAGLSYRDALARAAEFLLSEHVATIPVADITSRLHAALAVLSKGPKARPPRPSDVSDIEHIATFAPYVDFLVADRFFSDLCNQGHIRIGERYGCTIRTLSPADVPGVIDELKECTRRSPQAILKDRITRAIEEGGFHEDFSRRIEAHLRRRGAWPPKES